MEMHIFHVYTYSVYYDPLNHGARGRGKKKREERERKQERESEIIKLRDICVELVCS